MKKYISDAGFSFRANYDDLINKQFALESVSYDQSESSVLGNIILDRTEVYSLFLKDINTVLFKTKLETIINNAIADGVNVTDFATIDVIKVENGFEVTLNFTIKGD